MKGGEKVMKKWKLIALVAVMAIALITLGFVYATNNKDQQKEKAAVTKEETHAPHQEGSSECIEAHKSGKCTGHEEGEPHHTSKEAEISGNGDGQEHEEGSAECIEAHKRGKCTRHKPGEPHGHKENHVHKEKK